VLAVVADRTTAVAIDLGILSPLFNVYILLVNVTPTARHLALELELECLAERLRGAHRDRQHLTLIEISSSTVETAVPDDVTNIVIAQAQHFHSPCHTGDRWRLPQGNYRYEV
jgi:hypothetical protein